MSQQTIKATFRVTTPFLQAIPNSVKHFDAQMYAIVARKKEKIYDHKYGVEARIDPCILDWDTKTITVYLPKNINYGLLSIDDLEPSFYESLEACFLALLQGCIQ